MFALKLMFAGVVHMFRWPRLSIMHGMQAWVCACLAHNRDSVSVACALAVLSLFCFCCCMAGVSIMSCFLIGAGVAWFPGAVRPSPAAKARKQVVKINQGGQGLGNPKFSQNIMLGIYGQFLSMSWECLSHRFTPNCNNLSFHVEHAQCNVSRSVSRVVVLSALWQAWSLHILIATLW